MFEPLDPKITADLNQLGATCAADPDGRRVAAIVAALDETAKRVKAHWMSAPDQASRTEASVLHEGLLAAREIVLDASAQAAAD
ncbi:type III secretion system protein [Burkholderia sp. BCC1977]|uniref:type III secretion system protein n=1 Tax=Burkholderia sp. BCC1977 TaxID=2817440 RepID=UPI002ABDDC56|nr:type III secretion system protein [Burkholderia sp. BCC1977]